MSGSEPCQRQLYRPGFHLLYHSPFKNIYFHFHLSLLCNAKTRIPSLALQLASKFSRKEKAYLWTCTTESLVSELKVSAPTERTVLSEVLSQVTCKQGSGIIRGNGSTVLKERGGVSTDKLGLAVLELYR